MNLKFYTSVAKGLRLKVRKFWGVIPTFVEVTGEKLVGGPFRPPILNKVNGNLQKQIITTLYLRNKANKSKDPIVKFSDPCCKFE